MASAPLIITKEVIALFQELNASAARNPIDVKFIVEHQDDDSVMQRHLAHMAIHTVIVPGPIAYKVTFSYETGHPIGMCRHLSISIDLEHHLPSPDAVWMIAEYFDFVGGLSECVVYPERFSKNIEAINLVQPVSATKLH